MKKYSTSEAIAMLEKNPRAKLTTTLGGNKYELLVDGKNNNYFVFNVYTKNGEKISSSTGGGGFNYNIPTDLKWELIQQPVDFLTAVKAYSEGKTIICERHGTRFKFDPFGLPSYLSSFVTEGGASLSCIDVLEGTWYVEDSNE